MKIIDAKTMDKVKTEKLTQLLVKEYEEFWTDMFCLSIRKGPNFGPHGKLY